MRQKNNRKCAKLIKICLIEVYDQLITKRRILAWKIRSYHLILCKQEFNALNTLLAAFRSASTKPFIAEGFDLLWRLNEKKTLSKLKTLECREILSTAMAGKILNSEKKILLITIHNKARFKKFDLSLEITTLRAKRGCRSFRSFP